MNTLTYQQQWDKLTEAYIKGEVNPEIDCACFIGNLLNKNGYWAAGRRSNFVFDGNFNPVFCRPTIVSSDHLMKIINIEANGLYSPDDIIFMERIFLNTYLKNRDGGSDYEIIDEDALFLAFEVTLDLLKEIHIEKGEVIDEVKPFIKRKLINHETANMEY